MTTDVGGVWEKSWTPPTSRTDYSFYLKESVLYSYTKDSPEEWHRIWEFPMYAVSSWGRIINAERSYILKPKAFSDWYPLKVSLSDKQKGTGTRMVHRLVAEAFMSNFKPNTKIVFIDDDKHNCHILNLRPMVGSPGRYIPGTQNVVMRRLMSSDGDEYLSVLEAASARKVDPAEIYDVIEGRRSYIRGVTFEWVWVERMPDDFDPLFRADRSLAKPFLW